MDRKTFFLDLDGTVLTKEKKATPRTIEAMRKTVAAGHKLVVCTGRYVGWYSRFVGTDTPIRYMIGSNGAHILDLETGESIYKNPIDTEPLIKVIKAAQRPGILFNFSAGSGAYATERTRDDISAFRYTEFIEEDLESWLRKHDVFQVNFISYDIETVRKLRDDLISAGLLNGESDMQISNQSKAMTDPRRPVNNYTFFEINKGGCNKGVAIKKFCDKFGVRFEDTIAIGDDLNDRKMFSAVAYKVAMGNALDEIKTLADRVIGTNQEDGVAEFLEKFYS